MLTLPDDIVTFIAICESMGCKFRPNAIERGKLHVEIANTNGKLGESHLDAGLRSEICRREGEIMEFLQYLDDPEQV